MPPREAIDGKDTTKLDRAMDDVAQAIQDHSGAPTFRSINAVVRGGQELIREAITALEADGYLRIENGPNKSKLHHLLKPYPDTDTPSLQIAV
ncbi:hypothetical protein AHiyo8_48490 [Arthrobacter sp. Hiyo8]|nr:hypothetical protein AHiyo8_48490 [Arthrobacter sp. Hiyo8]